MCLCGPDRLGRAQRNALRQPFLTLIPILVAACVSVTADPARAQQNSGAGLPVDWSHRHLIYSNPDTREEAAAKGKLDEWLRKANDPRFVLRLEQKEHEVAQRSAAIAAAGSGESSQKVLIAAPGSSESSQKAVIAAAGSGESSTKSATLVPISGLPTPGTGIPVPTPISGLPKKPNPREVHRDWSSVMGGATGVGSARLYPAKFAFGISTKDCTNDFVVYTTASAGAAGTSGTLASQTGTFADQPTAGQTATIGSTAHGTSIVLSADASLDVGLKFSIGATTTITATNLANAINRNGATAGVTASSSGAVVTVTAVTWGTTPNTDITLASTLGNFTWAGATLAGGTGTAAQPTIFALNNLYADTVANTGCQTATQAVPAVYWSYNTGTGATADLSPALSFYGDQVAFIQKAASVASLVLLKWSASSPGTLGVPTTPTSVAAASYRSCTAPCMTVITFNGSPNDTYSSPFVDYNNDTLYVGDDSGVLHKFTGVFGPGTPAEQTTGGWPVTVSASNKLSSPVYDSGPLDVGLHLVYVGSNGNTGSGNRLHSVNSTGTVVNSGAIGSASTAQGVLDAPIVDSSAQRVYAFVGEDNGGNDSTGTSGAAACPAGSCSSVFQFSTSSSLATQNAGLGAGLGAKIILGPSSSANNTNRAISIGAFDNAYYTSASGSNPSGNLFVCGPSTSTQQKWTLFQIPIVNNAFSSVIEGPLLVSATSSDGCSPVTVFQNGSVEYIFVSVAASGAASGGSGCTTPASGCMYQYPAPGVIFNTTSTTSTPTSGTTFYMSVSTSVALNTTESNVTTTFTAATAGGYQGMTITQNFSNAGGVTYTYVLRKNGANTSITCVSASGGGSSCSDTTHSATFAVGDTIDVSVLRAGSGTTNNKLFTVQLNGFAPALNATAAINANGGAGGIIIDNTVSGGGSQIYYATRTSPGNAVQASQAALQ